MTSDQQQLLAWCEQELNQPLKHEPLGHSGLRVFLPDGTATSVDIREIDMSRDFIRRRLQGVRAHE
jgi:hypothetical protein